MQQTDPNNDNASMGQLARLVTANGAEWALWGEGQALLEQMAKADVKSVGGLLGHADVEIKKLGCSLIARSC